MTVEQTCLLPSIAEERYRNLEALLGQFLAWFHALPVTEGDRRPVEWFAAEAEAVLQDPESITWLVA